MSRRTEKISATIQRQLQALLARGLSDPRIQGLITVTRVRVTEDLETAVVSISVLPAEQQKLTMHGLRAASGFLRRELGKHLELRRLPALRFELDESLKREAEVLAALERVRAERPAADEDASPTDDRSDAQ